MTENGLIRPSNDESVEERTIYPAPEDYPTSESTEPEQYESFEEPTDPVPVYIVGVPPRVDSITDWAAKRVTVGSTSIQIAGDNRNRKGLVITNNEAAGGDSVFLIRRATDATFSGYELLPTASVEMLHNSAVWAVCNPGEQATVSVVDEYEIEDLED